MLKACIDVGGWQMRKASIDTERYSGSLKGHFFVAFYQSFGDARSHEIQQLIWIFRLRNLTGYMNSFMWLVSSDLRLLILAFGSFNRQWAICNRK